MSVNFSGVISERQSFLDGARTLTIDAEDQSSLGWRLSFSFRRPRGTEAVDEGELALVDPLGAELIGTLNSGTAAEATDEDGVVEAEQLDLLFDVTYGEGGYAAASGTLRVTGTIAGQGSGTGGSFEGAAGEGIMLTVEMDVSGAGAVWQAPSEQEIPTGVPRRDQQPDGDAPAR